MNNEEDHLTIEQIESLIGIPSTSERGSGDEMLREHAELHLEKCAACQQALEMEIKACERLQDLKAKHHGSTTEECASMETLYKIAGGVLAGVDAEVIMTHVTGCDHCALQFRQAVSGLASEMTADETVRLGSLHTAKPDGQKLLAHKLAEASRTEEKSSAFAGTKHARFDWRPMRLRWAIGSAVLILLAVFITFTRWQSSPRYAEHLLASAYAERRTMQLRIPNAKYGPLRVGRGTGSSNFDRPATLLRAEELISRQLNEHPSDEAWLQARARADLMDGNYEAALRSLQLLPESPAVLTDLATAYFERAQTTERSIDYGNAVEMLGRALAKLPEDQVALFNRALVCERISLFTQAIDDWERYLRLDPEGQWANEAREHLHEIKGKQKLREKTKIEPLRSPGIFKGRISEAMANLQNLSDHPEDYLYLAIESGLGKAYLFGSLESKRASEIELALRDLAKAAGLDHRDLWLGDLMASATHRDFADAVDNLSKATEANDRAEANLARRYSTEALNFFRSKPSDDGAGALRARLEAISAAKVDQNGEECLRDASSAQSAASKRSYTWLEIQFLLEKGSCQWLLGNLGDARHDYLNAAEKAQSSGYKTLYLRSQDHLSGIEAEMGNYETAWTIASEALNHFWSENYPDIRGYNLYYNYYELSRIRHQPYLQLAAWRDGVALSQWSADIAQRAMAHSMLANAAWLTNNPRIAQDEFNEAEKLFSLSPDSESTRLTRIEIEARRAMVETSLGQTDQAIARLKTLEPDIEPLTDRYLAVLFYTTLGDAQLHSGDSRSAAAALKSAVALSETQLASLSDEESRVDWSAKTNFAYRDLVEIQLQEGHTESALQLWESYRGASLRGANASSRLMPGMNRALPLLSGVVGQTLISFALLPRSLAIWVYDERGIRLSWNWRKPGELEGKVAAFQRLCENPRSDQANLVKSGRNLYQLLLAPVESWLSSDHDLVIEPDDRLAGLAFDALVNGEGKYFGDKTAISLSLGSYYDMVTRPSSPITSDSSALIVAVRSTLGVPDLALAPLPDTEPEAEMIAAKFREARVLTGQEITREAVLHQLQSSQVFHFAGHALASPRRSGLVLPDSLLRATAFDPPLVSNLQLAVLSACNSEDGSNGGVADNDSLVRKLLSDGVPRIVASRWQVDSVMTSRFMASFYDDVLRGESVAKAIHNAQSKLRSDGQTAHPFYWAAFVVFGRT